MKHSDYTDANSIDTPAIINRACPINCKGDIIAEWRDKPDSEGFNWYLEDGKALPCYVKLPNWVQFWQWEFPIDIERKPMKGKWQKATIPSLPEAGIE